MGNAIKGHYKTGPTKKMCFLAYAPTQDLKKCFLTENIKPVMLVLPNHASKQKIATDYYWISSQVLLYPKVMKTFLVL